jgi:hypothetical protein
VRRRDSYIFWTVGSQIAVRMPALRAGRSLPQGRFVMLMSVRGLVAPGVIVRLEGVGQFKNPMASSGTLCSILPQPTTQPRVSVL